jgi:phytol kinase
MGNFWLELGLQWRASLRLFSQLFFPEMLSRVVLLLFILLSELSASKSLHTTHQGTLLVRARRAKANNPSIGNPRRFGPHIVAHGRDCYSTSLRLVPGDFVLTAGTFSAAYAWLQFWITMVARDLVPAKLSRKIIHSGSAPLAMLLWPFYSQDPASKYVAAIVPLLQVLRLAAAGYNRQKTVKDGKGDLVSAISRGGERSEALQGPLIYTIVLLCATLFGFRDYKAGIVAVAQMAVGDGVADIFGRRWGTTKWPWSASRSIVGSAAFVIGAFSASAALLYYFSSFGCFDFSLAEKWPLLAVISVACAAVELIEVGNFDDNWTVPICGAVLSVVLLGS